MAKITRHEGATLEPDKPLPERRQTPASPGEVLHDRGKLGPYPAPRTIPGVDDGPSDESEDPAQVPEPEPAVAMPGAGPDDSDDEAEAIDALRPSTTASKADWVAFARLADPHGDRIGGTNPDFKTKQQLIETYG